MYTCIKHCVWGGGGGAFTTFKCERKSGGGGGLGCLLLWGPLYGTSNAEKNRSCCSLQVAVNEITRSLQVAVSEITRLLLARLQGSLQVAVEEITRSRDQVAVNEIPSVFHFHAISFTPRFMPLEITGAPPYPV